jgi:hypothetical protein
MIKLYKIKRLLFIKNDNDKVKLIKGYNIFTIYFCTKRGYNVNE